MIHHLGRSLRIRMLPSLFAACLMSAALNANLGHGQEYVQPHLNDPSAGRSLADMYTMRMQFEF